jgi:uncharacterized repeat protein (TIGR03806 family)
MIRSIPVFLFLTLVGFLCAFKSDWSAGVLPAAPKETLSEYRFFTGALAKQVPQDGVMPYALNTPLFSDYAEKLRFVKIPVGQPVAYNSDNVLDFPVGTTLIKTFYYPVDARDAAKGRRLMETRLLLHEASGWKALEYIWNDEQTEAYLEVAGDTKPVAWIDAKGQSQSLVYSMPNLNQCKGCHNKNEKMTPIGPSVRQLNGELNYGETTENQLAHWQETGLLTSMPALETIPKLPKWNDATAGTIESRARAWLDINCAHCHSPSGPARTSGLFLHWQETDPTHLGVMKTPVAAGRGSGGREYSIVPGEPDKSILMYRISSEDPGAMMPELGRKTTHLEGVALVREWIETLAR